MTGPLLKEMEGPEYEATNALGPMCWVGDPAAIIYANRLCNEYGLDTISTGVTLPLRWSCTTAGCSTTSRSWRWNGQTAALHGLIERIAYGAGWATSSPRGAGRGQRIGRSPSHRHAGKGAGAAAAGPPLRQGLRPGHAT